MAQAICGPTHSTRLTSPLCAGVLDEPNCMWKSDDLDHAVLLVGYGTCPMTGKAYWLIKNSWSTYWGDDVSFL